MDKEIPIKTGINTEEIKRKSFIGVAVLTSRNIVLQVITLIAQFVLSVILSTEAYGIFIVVTASVNFLNYFSDIGLAGALIQKKDEPSPDDLATTFTIQQFLVGIAVFVALLFSFHIDKLYKFGNNGVFLFRAMVISFMLSSLKTIPSIILERKLDFHKLILPQIAETVVFYIIAILLALKGLGVQSYAWAALARGLTGVIVLYLIAPWKPEFKIKMQSAKNLLSFGIPYQTTSFLALLKDDLLIAYLGIILPFTQIGYIGWAKKWSEIALRLFMDNIIKVTFPMFSRLQNESAILAKGIEKSLTFLVLVTFPIAIGMMFLIKPFTMIIPSYSKWQPALISFYLFTISAILATISSPLFNALNALGKVKYTFYLMIMWTVLTWLLVPITVRLVGFNGYAIVATIIGLTSFIPIIFVKKIVCFSFLKQLIRPTIAASFLTLVLIMLSLLHLNPLLQILTSVFIGAIIYISVIYQLMSVELLPYIQLFFRKYS